MVLAPTTLYKVFGCTCFVLLPPNEQNKLSSCSSLCIFLGYSIEQKGYRCYDPIARRLRISRNVIFFENIPFSKISYFDSSISAKTSASLDIPNSLFLEMNVNHVPSEHDISSAPTDSNETS